MHSEKMGMGGILGMMFGPFGPPPWFYEESGGDMNHMDGVTLSILAGMAKPGDDIETIRKNIATAREYAKEVERQWRQGVEDEVKATQAKQIEKAIKIGEERLAHHLNHIKDMEAALEEQDRILAATGINPNDPKTEAGRAMVNDRHSIARKIENLKGSIADMERSLKNRRADLDDLQGKPPVEAPPEAKA